MARKRSPDNFAGQPPPEPEPKSAPPPLSWPADAVKRRKLDELLPYVRNSVHHTVAQVDAIARAIREFGWTVPVVIDETGEIIAGHGRVMAARKLGLAAVPVVTAQGWTAEQKRAYRIWDNQSTRLSEWAPENLRLELSDLKRLGVDLSITGFDPNSLVEFMALPRAPDSFPAVDGNISTEHSCPRCGYRWSGVADAAPAGAQPPEAAE